MSNSSKSHKTKIFSPRRQGWLLSIGINATPNEVSLYRVAFFPMRHIFSLAEGKTEKENETG